MSQSQISFTAPHWAATETGMMILESGGNAVEAMVAAAATIASVYPHMNSIGGDGFWIISQPGKQPISIDACGTAAGGATIPYFEHLGVSNIPSRGGQSAITMAGTVAGWIKALDLCSSWPGRKIPIADLLQDAIDWNKNGITATQSLSNASSKTFNELKNLQHFSNLYQPESTPIKPDDLLNNSKLADTFGQLAKAGLNDFYQGDIAKSLSNDLSEVGSQISIKDFETYQATIVNTLTTSISKGQLFNLPAPTQGVASLMILALFDRVRSDEYSDAEQIHLLIECTKQAFLARDRLITDSSRVDDEYSQLLDDEYLDNIASKIDLNSALPWPRPSASGDTIWMGACDANGNMVSFIQSIYWEFGSGVVLPETGILWNNRGVSFSLDPHHHNSLQPGMRPFHTLNPAYAELSDGRRMVYGTMGGEGQPQTQAAIFNRYVYQHLDLKQALAAPRWLLGRTWGDEVTDLKIEKALAQKHLSHFQNKGHILSVIDDYSELMGHSGAVVLKPDLNHEAATDPRSDGSAQTNDFYEPCN